MSGAGPRLRVWLWKWLCDLARAKKVPSFFLISTSLPYSGGSPRVWRSEVESRQKKPVRSMRGPGDRRPRPLPAPPCLLREDGLGPRDATSASGRVEREAERAAAGRPSLKAEKDRGSLGSP